MIPGVVGAVVMSTAPAVTAAASMLLLGDQPTWRKLVAIALAVVGVLILNLGQGGPEEGSRSMLLGVALVFGAVCCEAAYNLLGKKATERVDPILVAGLSAALSLPVFLPLAVWSGATSRSPRPAGARGRRSPGTGPAPWRSAAGSGTRAWPGRRAPSPPASWA